jgi:hypothetical protein
MPAPAAANTAAPTPRELMAVLATVDELVIRAADFQRTAQELQSRFPSASSLRLRLLSFQRSFPQWSRA